MPEALLALVVIVLLPIRAWRRHRRGAPPSPPAVYLLEIAVLTGSTAGLLAARGVPLEAIGAQPPSLPRFALDLAISLVPVIGLDVLSMRLAASRLRRGTAMPSVDGTGIFGDALHAKRAVAWFIPVAIAGALWEELCFRGVTFLLVPQTAWGLAGGVALGSLLFGCQHLRNGVAGLAYTSFYGVLFSCVYLITRDLVAVIAAHAAGNLFAALYATPRLARLQQAQTPVFWA